MAALPPLSWALGKPSVAHGPRYTRFLLSHVPPLRAVEAGGQGDCLFRSVAALIMNDPQKYQYFREVVAQWLESNADSDLARHACQAMRMVDGKQVAFGTVSQYCDYIRRLKGWGGASIELQVLADCLGVDFEILSVDLSPPFNVRSRMNRADTAQEYPCYALCFSRGHVQPLFPVAVNLPSSAGRILPVHDVCGVPLGSGEAGLLLAAQRLSASGRDQVVAHKCATCPRSIPVSAGSQCDLCQFDCARPTGDTLTAADVAAYVPQIEEARQRIQRELKLQLRSSSSPSSTNSSAPTCTPSAVVLMFVLSGDTHQSLKESVHAWNPALPHDTEWLEDGIAVLRELAQTGEPLWPDAKVDRAFVAKMRIQLLLTYKEDAAVEDCIMSQLRSPSFERVVATPASSAALSPYLLSHQLNWIHFSNRLTASLLTPQWPDDVRAQAALSRCLQSSLAIVIRTPDHVRELMDAHRRAEGKTVADHEVSASGVNWNGPFPPDLADPGPSEHSPPASSSFVQTSFPRELDIAAPAHSFPADASVSVLLRFVQIVKLADKSFTFHKEQAALDRLDARLSSAGMRCQRTNEAKWNSNPTLLGKMIRDTLETLPRRPFRKLTRSASLLASLDSLPAAAVPQKREEEKKPWDDMFDQMRSTIASLRFATIQDLAFMLNMTIVVYCDLLPVAWVFAPASAAVPSSPTLHFAHFGGVRFAPVVPSEMAISPDRRPPPDSDHVELARLLNVSLNDPARCDQYVRTLLALCFERNTADGNWQWRSSCRGMPFGPLHQSWCEFQVQAEGYCTGVKSEWLARHAAHSKSTSARTVARTVCEIGPTPLEFARGVSTANRFAQLSRMDPSFRTCCYAPIVVTCRAC